MMRKKRLLGMSGAIRASMSCLAPWILLLCVSPIVEAAIELNVTRVGFPTRRQGDVIRHGTWTPVIVDIALIGEARFDGALRVAQYDADGDECYDTVEVHLRSETGGAGRYHLYVVANPLRRQGRFVVELLDDRGELVEVVCQGEPTRSARPAQKPVSIPHDDILILSISDGAIGAVTALVDTDELGAYARDLRVAHMSPADLPELGLGLEAVDYVVWDNARPEALTQRQQDALIDWVRQGGTLLIAASRSAGSILLSDTLNDVLPVDLGEVTVVEDLPKIRRALLQADLKGGGFPTPVPVVRCTLREGATAIAPAKGIEAALLARHPVDRGSVIFSGVTLADLLKDETGSCVPLFRRLFHLVLASGDTRPSGVSLFANVVAPVSFATRAGWYLLLAGAFSLAYLLASTLGSWWFLGRRGWRHHAWSVFALVAAAATVLSLVTVQSVRGFGSQLHQVSVIDADAGQAFGSATVFFGLKTSMDRNLDVWMPSDPDLETQPGLTACTLRPLPPSNALGQTASSFVDPGTYQLVPASALIQSVRIRATLKRFEGRWKGALGGRLIAGITVRKNTVWEETEAERRKRDRPRGRNELIEELTEPDKPEKRAHRYDWRITEDSYIVNELGVDLTDCYLLHAVFDLDGRFGMVGNRGDAIYAYPIGNVPADGKKLHLAPRCYAPEQRQTVFEWMKEHTLAAAQQNWSRPFRNVLKNLGYGAMPDTGLSLGEENNALLLLSTIGEFDPTKGATMGAYVGGLATWSRDRARQLDLRERLTRTSLYLIGFADAPGPARLFVRDGGSDDPYRRVDPDPRHARTMYRIRLSAIVEGEAEPEKDESETPL